jgi:ABC-type uncharacterized transport system fused permease/ATPase subunit
MRTGDRCTTHSPGTQCVLTSQVSYAQRAFINALSEKDLGAFDPLHSCHDSWKNVACHGATSGVSCDGLWLADGFYKAMWNFLLIIVVAIIVATLNPYVGACTIQHATSSNHVPCVSEQFICLTCHKFSLPCIVRLHLCGCTAESHLQLAWRTNMTNTLCNEFFNGHTHYRVVHTEGIDNPDQRISQDVGNFVVRSSKLILKFTSTVFNTVAFGGNAHMRPVPCNDLSKHHPHLCHFPRQKPICTE